MTRRRNSRKPNEDENTRRWWEAERQERRSNPAIQRIGYPRHAGCVRTRRAAGTDPLIAGVGAWNQMTKMSYIAIAVIWSCAQSALAHEYIAVSSNSLLAAHGAIAHQYFSQRNYVTMTNYGLNCLIMRKQSESSVFLAIDISPAAQSSVIIDVTIYNAESAQVLATRSVNEREVNSLLLEQLVNNALSNNCERCGDRIAIGWAGSRHLAEDKRRIAQACLARLVADRQLAVAGRDNLQEIIELQDVLSDKIGVPRKGRLLPARRVIKFRPEPDGSLGLTIYDSIEGKAIFQQQIMNTFDHESFSKQMKAK
jgi:hypothetical protein